MQRDERGTTRRWGARDDLTSVQLMEDSGLSGLMEPDNYDMHFLLLPQLVAKQPR